jgi:hypothetical protein
LTKHFRAGIGIAVAVLDGLPMDLSKRAKELDFGLWVMKPRQESTTPPTSRVNAYSVFRKREGRFARKMELVFSNGGENKEVQEKVRPYQQLSHLMAGGSGYSQGLDGSHCCPKLPDSR